MLLDFPPELIQLVLKHSTTPTFIQLALSCRTLLAIASTSRDVVLHHLDQTPGPCPGYISLWKTTDLFRILKSRSDEQLHGAEIYASCNLLYSEGKTIDTRASSFSFADNLNFCNTRVVLVFKNHETVYLLQANDDGHVRLRSRLRYDWGKLGRVEVLRTAFDSPGNVHVLQRFGPDPSADQDGLDTGHPFVKQALHSGSKTTHLVQYMTTPYSRNEYGGMRICAFREHADFEPLGLAAANEETFAISWHKAGERSQNEVAVYTTLEELTDNEDDDYESKMKCDDSGKPVVDLAFNDRDTQLLYYYRGQTLYGSFQGISSSDVIMPIHLNMCEIRSPYFWRMRFSVAIPFFGTHETEEEPDPDTQVIMCHWRYLSFGIGKQKGSETIACLLISEAFCRESNCTHTLNLDRGRRFSKWKVACQLMGFQDSTNSLGCIVATSKLGRRLAVANWDVLQVWALEPESLILENGDAYYPRCFQSPDSEIVELHPVTFHLGAVCFKLRFMNDENTLLAITDRGLMKWDFSPSGQGKRTVTELEL